MVAFGSAGLASGQVQLFFNPPGFEWFHPSGGASPNHIWVAGDYWAQTFPPTTLPSASTMSLRIFVDSNGLALGASINLDVKLNGVTVGQAAIQQGVTGPIDFQYAFASVAGPGYRVELLETNTVPPGQGAASMGLGNQSWVVLSGACYPDCNADGSLTVADFGCFQTRFVAGDPYADCNGDGVRTVADFGCFQTKFVAGCP